MVLHFPKKELVKHQRPLYVQAQINDKPVSKVLAGNGVVVNILHSRMLKVLNKGKKDMLYTDITISNFAGGSSCTKGISFVQLQVGNRTTTIFFVVDFSSKFNSLLGGD